MYFAVTSGGGGAKPFAGGGGCPPQTSLKNHVLNSILLKRFLLHSWSDILVITKQV